MKIADMTEHVEAEITSNMGSHLASIPLVEKASAIGEDDNGNTVAYIATDRGMYLATYAKGGSDVGRQPRITGTLTMWEDVTRPVLTFAGFGGKLDYLTFSLAAPTISASASDTSGFGLKPLLDLADECARLARGWRPGGESPTP